LLGAYIPYDNDEKLIKVCIILIFLLPNDKWQLISSGVSSPLLRWKALLNPVHPLGAVSTYKRQGNDWS
jgi:hypothetical protein